MNRNQYKNLISSLISSLHKHKEDEIFALLQTYNNIPHKTVKLRLYFTGLLSKIIGDNEEQLQNTADQMMPTGIKKIKSLQGFENMKYLIKTHLNIQDDEDTSLTRTKIAGGSYEYYDSTDLIHSTYYPGVCDLKILKQQGHDHRFGKIDECIKYVFKNDMIFPDDFQFPAAEDLYTAKLRSVVINTLNLPLKQSMTTKDIDTCRTMIAGGNVEEYNEEGVLLSCTYFESLVTQKFLKDRGLFSCSVFLKKSFINAFPELFPDTFPFIITENLYIAKLRSIIINQLSLPLKQHMTEENINECRTMIAGGNREEYDEQGVLLSCTYFENLISQKTVKDFGFNTNIQQNPSRYFTSAFPELFVQNFDFPGSYNLQVASMRCVLIKDKKLVGVYKSKPTLSEREHIWQLISDDVGSRVDYFIKNCGNRSIITRGSVINTLQYIFPELHLTQNDLKTPLINYAMNFTGVTSVYQTTILNYINDKYSVKFPIDPDRDWHLYIRYVLPPYLQKNNLNDLRIYGNTEFKKRLGIDHYSDLIRAAFPNYPLKRIMYGKTGGGIKSKKANFRVEAMQAIPVSDTQQIEMYTLRDEDKAKAQELLQQYIHQQKKYEIRRDKKSIVFEKLCEMLTELEEMRHHYDLDTLIKGAISRSIQTEKRNNVKALWNNVASNYYQDGKMSDDTVLSTAVYKKTDGSHNDNQLIDTIDGMSITTRRQTFGDYLDTLDNTDTLKRAFIKTVAWFKKQPKNAQANQQDMILQLVHNAHMTVQEIIARFEEEYDGDEEDSDF